MKEKLITFKRDGDGNEESYPKGWIKVVLVMSPDGQQMHAIGGDRAPGEGDQPYLGLELLKTIVNKT